MAVFAHLACSNPDREFGTAGGGTGGASSPVGVAGSGEDTSAGAGGKLAGGSGTGGDAETGGDAGASGNAGAGGNAGTGPALMCVTDSDCASQPNVRPGAPVHCPDGKCAIPASSCASGFGHCSASSAEYCETDLTTPANCGSCGKACPASAPLCAGGTCAMACPSDKPTICNGTCVNTKTDAANCGGCGTSCAQPNADVTCVNSACGAPACKPGYGDCGAGAGCETRLNTLTNCGTCNKTCGAAGDTASCATGVCNVSCVKTTENCFNGMDDDCDGLPDCADPDCTVTAMCVPAGTFTFGTSVTSQTTCPNQFQGTGVTLHGGLNTGTGCTGCGCNPTTTDCAPYSLKIYNSTNACATQGTLVNSYSINQFTTTCTALNIGGQAWNGMYLTASPKANCANTGTATLSTATWGTNSKFCAAATVGAGCASGQVCAPIPAGSACVLASGTQTCPGAFPKQQALYAGFTDTRSCSCSCQALDGDCNNVALKVSGDPSGCSDAFGSFGGGACKSVGTSTQLGYVFSGAPTNPTSCQPSNVMGGSITPNGANTLCCQ